MYEAISGADWWQGEVKGVVGSFPATYVELTKKPESRMVRADALYDNQVRL